MSAAASNEYGEGPSPRLIQKLTVLHSYFQMLCGDRQNSPFEQNGFTSSDMKAIAEEDADAYIIEVFNEMLEICYRFFKKASPNASECSTEFITLLGDEPQSRFSNNREIATPINAFIITDNIESYLMDWEDLNRQVRTPKQFLIWYIANAFILKVFNASTKPDSIAIASDGQRRSKMLLLAYSLFYLPGNGILQFFKEAGLELTAEDHVFINELFRWDEGRHNSHRMRVEN